MIYSEASHHPFRKPVTNRNGVTLIGLNVVQHLGPRRAYLVDSYGRELGRVSNRHEFAYL